MSLSIDPPQLQISAAGGAATHNLVNCGETRLAFKIKSTNNNQYRLKPVFGFVEPNSSTPVEIIRTEGPPRDDKLVIQYLEVSEDITDLAAHFKANEPQGNIELPISATE